MKPKYLVSCDCGRKTPVEPAHAGQTLACACGRQVEVPPLRELSFLERVEAKAPARRRLPATAWGPRHRRLLLGGVIAVPALALAIYFHAFRPRLVDIEMLTPAQTWPIWLELRRGADRRPAEPVTVFEENVKTNHLWIGVTGTAGGIGLLIVLSGMLTRGPRPTRSSQKPPQARVPRGP